MGIAIILTSIPDATFHLIVQSQLISRKGNRMKRIKSVAMSCIALLAAFACSPANAVVAVSNMSNATPGNDIGLSASDYPVAQSFTTGDSPSTLSSISAKCYDTEFSFRQEYYGAVYTDEDGLPGVELESFSYPVHYFPTYDVTVTFQFSGIYLAPHTTYWFLLSNNAGVTPYWYNTVDKTESSDYGWSIGNNILRFSRFGWQASGGMPPDYPYQIGLMSIDVTFVPEPVGLVAAGWMALAMMRRRR